MGVVIEICIKYPGGRTRMKGTDMQWPFPNGHKCPFGYSGYVTAVAAGQSQRFYSGVGIFNWYYLSSPPQIPHTPEVQVQLE
jgi:hypothetical protein